MRVPHATGVEANFQSAGDAALIRRAERMRAIGVARDGRFGVRPQCRESGEKWCRQKRHIARYHQHLFRGRFDQRRIQTTERTRPRYAICDDRDSDHLSVRRVSADNQDMRGNRAEHRELPFEDRRRADHQRALVAAAEPPRLAAGKYCC